MYNPSNGDLLLSFENSMQGTVVYGKNGEMLVYTIDSTNGWISRWNSTKALTDNFLIAGLFGFGPEGMYTPMPGTYDWMAGIEWNNTIPPVPLVPMGSFVVDDVLIGTYGTFNYYMPYHVGYSLETGEQLWAYDRTKSGSYPLFFAAGEGTYAQWDQQQAQWTAYDASTGIEKWISDETVYPWGLYLGGSDGGLIAYGKLYSLHLDGYVHAFDLETGEEAWKFFSGPSELEDPYNAYPFWNGPIIADGVVFAATGDMMPPQPFVRGYRLYAIDAESGDEIWSLSGNLVTTAIADGYLMCESGYDNRLYCIGKGPSAITATASPKVISLGNWVQIEGSVTDISAGTTQSEQQARFPNGVPAIADEHMGAWMEYVYMQKPKPENAEGVPVKIQIVDPNGEYAWIGTTTSDAEGNYVYSFIPQLKGIYTVIATFDGSESYWGSETTTYLTVGDAPLPYPSDPGYQGPSAQEVANRVLADLPEDPTADEISQAVINQMPEYPEPAEIPEYPEYPEYTTIDLIIIVLVAITLIISLVCLFRKR
jgi:outer membrane protein assembly factor BamB